MEEHLRGKRKKGKRSIVVYTHLAIFISTGQKSTTLESIDVCFVLQPTQKPVVSMDMHHTSGLVSFPAAKQKDLLTGPRAKGCDDCERDGVIMGTFTCRHFALTCSRL